MGCCIMHNPKIVFISGMVVIACIEGVAIFYGINGVGLSASVGAVAAIAGYFAGCVREKIKKGGTDV